MDSVLDSVFINYADEAFQAIKLSAQNRRIIKSQVKKLKKELINNSKHRFLYPVVINKVTGNIVEGQHRVAAYREAIEMGDIPQLSTIEVRYIEETPEEEVKLMRSLNTSSKSWSITDFIDSFAAGGNQNYIRFSNWCKSHKKCMYSSKSTPKYSIGFTFFGFQSSSMCKDARNGKLVITEEDCYNASILYDEVDKIVNVLQTITNVNSKCLYYISVMWYRIKKEYNNKIDNFSTKFIDALDKHKKKVIQKGDDYTKLQTWDRIFRTVKSFVD